MKREGEVALSSQARPLILIADDNDDVLSTLTALMTREGYQVIGAKNGAEALRLAQAARPALVLLDVGMPGIDGWTAAEELKRNPSTQHIRVVMITAFAFAGSVPMARRPAWDGYLTKPLLVARLLRELREQLDTSASLRS